MELAPELQSYGLDMRPEWTLAELRELAKQEREERGSYKPKPPRDWGKLKLSGLQEACRLRNVRVPDRA
eukprot:7937070-Alexandrium_andersonii.AAC.1